MQTAVCLQSCQSLVDQLMNNKSGLFGHVTNCVDVVIPSNAGVVQVSDVKWRNMYVCICAMSIALTRHTVVVWCFAVF